MGQHTTALDYHLLDLEIGQRIGDKTAQIRASANIGETYEALGECIDRFSRDATSHS